MTASFIKHFFRRVTWCTNKIIEFLKYSAFFKKEKKKKADNQYDGNGYDHADNQFGRYGCDHQADFQYSGNECNHRADYQYGRCRSDQVDNEGYGVNRYIGSNQRHHFYI